MTTPIVRSEGRRQPSTQGSSEGWSATTWRKLVINPSGESKSRRLVKIKNARETPRAQLPGRKINRRRHTP